MAFILFLSLFFYCPTHITWILGFIIKRYHLEKSQISVCFIFSPFLQHCCVFVLFSFLKTGPLDSSKNLETWDQLLCFVISVHCGSYSGRQTIQLGWRAKSVFFTFLWFILQPNRLINNSVGRCSLRNIFQAAVVAKSSSFFRLSMHLFLCRNADLSVLFELLGIRTCDKSLTCSWWQPSEWLRNLLFQFFFL